MFAMSRSRHGKQPRTRYLVGFPPAMMNSAGLIVTILAVAGCGRTTTLAGISGAHATVTPTSPILLGTALSWTAGTLPPGYAMFSGFNNFQEDDHVGRTLSLRGA